MKTGRTNRNVYYISFFKVIAKPYYNTSSQVLHGEDIHKMILLPFS